MELKQLVPGLAVSAQLSPADMPALKAQGITTIICNRPDGEAPGQPDFADIHAAAATEGISAWYLPVTPGYYSAADAKALGELLNKADAKVVAYCRTGTRSTHLWAMAQFLAGADAQWLAQQAQQAGYDVSQTLASIRG